jgi:hypothetical protein
MDTFTLLFGGVSLFILIALFLNRKSKEEREEEEECEEEPHFK